MEFVREAGWAIFPVLLFGTAAVAVAMRHAFALKKRELITLRWLSALTILAGLLGTVSGIQASIDASTGLDFNGVGLDGRLVMVGLGEALNNLVASLALVAAAVLVVVAARLIPRRHSAV